MITIQGIKIDNINITKDSDGKEKITGIYKLISSEDKVLAKQGFNTYSDIEISWTASTIDALNEFMKKVKDDVKLTLGIKED